MRGEILPNPVRQHHKWWEIKYRVDRHKAVSQETASWPSLAVLFWRSGRMGTRVLAHSLSCYPAVSENPHLLFSELAAVRLRWIRSSYLGICLPRQPHVDCDLQTHRIILTIAANIYTALNSCQIPTNCNPGITSFNSDNPVRHVLISNSIL